MADKFSNRFTVDKGIDYSGTGGPGSELSTVMTWAVQSNIAGSATMSALPATANLYHVDQKLKSLINDLIDKKVIEPA